ncbi:MAG: hypothetical protein IT365_23405 [Candidatus Hydrogenedentes bacterium]|nr:hypothetical protein [Candidatus Hydrogenedentota bacterium]
MTTAPRYPGRTDAILSIVCMGLCVAVPFAWVRFRLSFVSGFVVAVVCMLLWGLSWGLAISSVRHGEGPGRTLGVFALILVIVFNLLLVSVLFPTV